VFAYWRLRGLFDGRWTVGDLVDFHTAHKLPCWRTRPRGIDGSGVSWPGRAKCRGATWSGATLTASCERSRSRRPRGGTRTWLQHMAGYFKDRLDVASKRELAEVIADYRHGLVPLVVPITLIRHHVRTL
jgi:uncharacterized protein YbgA (DUF1722 family)